MNLLFRALFIVTASAFLFTSRASAQSLNLKPGCWEVQNHSSREGANPGLSPDAIEQIISAQDEVRQASGRPPLSAADKASQRARYGAANQQANAALAQGGTTDQIGCELNLFANENNDIYGPAAPQCTRSIQSSGQVTRAHVACPGRVADYQRNSAESFASTTRITNNGAAQISVLTAKWISEAGPHMPSAPPATNLAGKIAKGAHAVAWLDRFRIVALVDNTQITAAKAYLLLNILTPQTNKSYGPTLSASLQEVYLHWSIANEAEHLNLDHQQPWSTQLADAGANTRKARVSIDAIGPADIDEVAGQERQMSIQEEGRERILWDAYFSQAKSDADKHTFERRIRDKYSLTVVDPDFFAN